MTTMANDFFNTRIMRPKNKSTNKNLRRVSLFELQNSPKALLFRARA